jgi:hypothetical protein
MYEKFLKRLEEITEYRWNNYDIKIHEEIVPYEVDNIKYTGCRGVKKGENALQAIARNMVEVLKEQDEILH